MAARTFTHEPEPLPAMTPCSGPGCGRGGEREDEFFILVEGKWLCRQCFHKGPGKTWPRRRENRPPLGKPVMDRSARLAALRRRE